VIFLEFRRALTGSPTPDLVEEFTEECVCRFLNTLKRRLKLKRDSFGLVLFRTGSWNGTVFSAIVRALYVGPGLPGDVQRIWEEIAEKADFLSVNPIEVDAGVAEVFGPEVYSPAQAARMEAIFDGARRVRTLGALYAFADQQGTTEASPTHGSEPTCPHCGAELTAILYARPIAEVIAEGFEDLDRLRQLSRAWPRAGPIAA
jgi:hypothetical protein